MTSTATRRSPTTSVQRERSAPWTTRGRVETNISPHGLLFFNGLWQRYISSNVDSVWFLIDGVGPHRDEVMIMWTGGPRWKGCDGPKTLLHNHLTYPRAISRSCGGREVITSRRRLPARYESRPPPTSRSRLGGRFRPPRHRTGSVIETQSLRWRRGDDVVLPRGVSLGEKRFFGSLIYKTRPSYGRNWPILASFGHLERRCQSKTG